MQKAWMETGGATVSEITKEAKFGTWKYYRNEEGKARWKCDQCGKICKRIPTEKLYCSKCGARMKMEA